MEHGSGALRSVPMWQGGASSVENRIIHATNHAASGLQIQRFLSWALKSRRRRKESGCKNCWSESRYLDSYISFAKFARPARPFFAKFPGASMKAKIIITPKKAVVDPQGKTVQVALEQMGYQGIKAVHVGKYLEIELDGTDREAARKALDEAAHKFFSNPVIEDYKLEIE